MRPAASRLNALLHLSRLIDALNERIGRAVMWLVLASVLISAGNAVVRKAFDVSSNAWLEIQWYLFAAVFLLAAGYTLLRDEHVRIDVVSGRLSRRGRAWIDVVGLVAFLLPFAGLVVWLSLPLFTQAWTSGEMSSSAGGLVRWPVYLLLPAGFALLALQGVSELVKRAAFLQGRIDDYAPPKRQRSAEDALAETIRARTGADSAPRR